MRSKRITVLVVDDSPVIRQVLSKLLLKDPLIREVHTAPSGKLALRKILRLDPDVVTLDVEMPVLDGLETLQAIMETSPRPVIMVSAVTHEGAEKTLKALELGAVDFIPKPGGLLSRDVAAIGDELREKIKAVARLREKWANESRPGHKAPALPTPHQVTRRVHLPRGGSVPEIVAIGASTGGTDAIREVLSHLPADFPIGTVMVQHMPPGFTRSFADRLNDLCALEVKEAANRDMLLPGRALLAPGDCHMVVRRGEHGDYVELQRTPEVSGHRPSVDVLFDSVAELYGPRSIGVLLTGMGRDGASGMRTLHETGATTLAQDEETCVVFGMPKAAINDGSVDFVANHAQIGEVLRLAASGDTTRRASNPQEKQTRRSNS